MSALEQRIKIDYIAAAKMRANNWNPNVVDHRTYEAIRESLRSYGFLLPVLLRSHPSEKGEWEIVDGEHRWKVAIEEGMAEIPSIVVDHLSEGDIKKLTIILNETRGQADTVPLARLLADLQKDTTLDDLIMGLPYERAQLEELLRIGSIEWDTFNSERSEDVERHLRLRGEKNQYTVFLNFDKAQKEKYDTYADMLVREKGEEYTVERAVIDGLAALCQQL